MAGSISENPPHVEIPTDPRQFLTTCFEAAVNKYSLAEGAEVLVDVAGVTVDNWDSTTKHPQGASISLPAELQRVVVVAQGGLIRGLVLSERHRTAYDWRPDKSFQFGIVNDREGIDWADLENLKLLFWEGMGIYHAGEVYTGLQAGKLSTAAWADSKVFGGKHLLGWNLEEQMSQRGFEEVMALVDRTFRNSTVMEEKLRPVTR